MAHNHPTISPIHQSVPDKQVPSEKIVTQVAARQQVRRAQRFLKGPILFSWIREFIKSPADRLLLVLVAHSDMRGVLELKISADILRNAGIPERKSAYRALRSLEISGAIIADRKSGRRPRVRLIRHPSQTYSDNLASANSP
jgi:hypothetical protein